MESFIYRYFYQFSQQCILLRKLVNIFCSSFEHMFAFDPEMLSSTTKILFSMKNYNIGNISSVIDFQ